MDYWRGLYDLFWCCACGDRLVRDHVGLCNRGGDLGPRWYIPTVVNAAIQGKHGEASLRRLLQVDAIGRPCVLRYRRTIPVLAGAGIPSFAYTLAIPRSSGSQHKVGGWRWQSAPTFCVAFAQMRNILFRSFSRRGRLCATCTSWKESIHKIRAGPRLRCRAEVELPGKARLVMRKDGERKDGESVRPRTPAPKPAKPGKG